MDRNATDQLARIMRSYDLLKEAALLLDKSGQADISAALYLPLGLLEDRFELASPKEIEDDIARKNASIDKS